MWKSICVLFGLLGLLLSGQASATARDIQCSIQPGLWLKLSQSESGWTLRRVSFPPARLKVTALTLEIAGQEPPERLPLSSAVIADLPESTSGPYYVHIGSRDIQDMRVLRGEEVLHVWHDIVSTAEKRRKERCQAQHKAIAYEMFAAWFLLRP